MKTIPKITNELVFNQKLNITVHSQLLAL